MRGAGGRLPGMNSAGSPLPGTAGPDGNSSGIISAGFPPPAGTIEPVVNDTGHPPPALITGPSGLDATDSPSPA
jgi:hypothetical protein